MNEIPLTELATGGVSISAILYVVKVFLKRLDDKDRLFTTTINNHLHEDKVVKEKMSGEFSKFVESNHNTSDSINRLISKLDAKL